MIALQPGRRRFEHLVIELSLALDRRVPRYALWLELAERGADPEDLERRAVLDFLEWGLDPFLGARGWCLRGSRRRRLRRVLARFDPSHPTPDERLEAWLGAPR